MKDIYLVILNITSWCGISLDAEHYYGKLILCNKKEVTIDNVCDWNINHLGDEIEIRRKLTKRLAKELDKKDGFGNFNLMSYNESRGNKEMADNIEGTTNRFDTIKQVIDIGIREYNKLNLTCPFICLYDGIKFSDTIILNSDTKTI